MSEGVFEGIKAVIFDMDGVLVDSQPFHFESDMRALAEVGASADYDAFAKYAGMPCAAIWGKVIAELHINAGVDEMVDIHNRKKFELARETKFVPIPGVTELIGRLKSRGLRLALASSTVPELIDYIIGEIGLAGAFEVVVSGAALERGKPFPDVFLLAAERLGVPPGDCAVIEDSSNGVKAAKAAGMFCVGYRNTSSGEQDLSAADAVVANFFDFLT